MNLKDVNRLLEATANHAHDVEVYARTGWERLNNTGANPSHMQALWQLSRLKGETQSMREMLRGIDALVDAATQQVLNDMTEEDKYA